MALKKALMISYYFPPYGGGGVYRSLKFAKYLPAFGWEPMVIAPRPKQYYWAFDYSLLKEIPEHIRVLRTRSFEPFYLFALFDKLGLRKLGNNINAHIFVPDSKIGWIPFALSKALKVIKSTDINVIYTTSPPHSAHLTGYLLKKLTGKPWVADFRDQWSLNPTYNPASKVIEVLNNALERRVNSECDRIIHANFTDRIRISRKYGLSVEKIVSIPNGYDAEDFRGKSACQTSNQFVIAYFGSFYREIEKTAESFLKGMELAVKRNKRLSQKLKIEFHGNIEINDKWLLHPIMGKMINVRGFISHQHAIEKMHSASLLLIIPYATSNNVISAKLFEYMATGKPTLALFGDSEAKTILKKANLGFYADPSDPQDIANTVLGLFERWAMGESLCEPNRPFIQRFERKRLTYELASLFNDLSTN